MKKKSEQTKPEYSLDIKDWCHQVDKKEIVIFERYENTLARSNPIEENEEYLTDEEDMQYIKTENIAVFHTPMGLAKMPQFTEVDKHFKLWTMYTRIPITEGLNRNLDSILGVETLQVPTPYRAIVGICPLFKDGEVLENIKKAVEQQNSLNKDQKVDSLVYKK